MTTAAPRIDVVDASFYVLPMQTRFPFRYGIASMTRLPHVLVEVHARVDGVVSSGVAAEGLPPKWFTKDPATTFEQDLPAMIESLRRAFAAAEAAEVGSFFELWAQVATAQRGWAERGCVPPLLAQLGGSLVERAVLDALCRNLQVPVGTLIRSGALDLDLGTVIPELAGRDVAELLPTQPATRMAARHTIGLGDPLDHTSDRVDDRLPHTLLEAIDAYGLRWFKVKISGVLDDDLDRLTRIATVLGTGCSGAYHVTLDGNEQFDTLEQFHEHWLVWNAVPEIHDLLARAEFVEQPLHRDHALDQRVGSALQNWPDAPPLIIDESDATPDSASRALALGYSGTSHKNCKGIVKGIANACLLEHRRRHDATRRFVLSGEDLANVGPVALLQDLAVLATLGVTHAERNGHHYFKGLSAFPSDVQDAVLAAHPDLYTRTDDGYATLRIENGELDLSSVVAAPFGLAPRIDPTRFTPLDDWLAR